MHNEINEELAELPMTLVAYSSPFLLFIFYDLFIDYEYPLLLSYLSISLLLFLACLWKNFFYKEKVFCVFFLISPFFSIAGYYLVFVLFHGNIWYSLVGGMGGFILSFIIFSIVELFIINK